MHRPTWLRRLPRPRVRGANPEGCDVMKMVMAVVPKEGADAIINDLVAIGHTATFVDSRGGALRQASQMLFIVVEDQDLERVLSSISGSCHYEMPVAETEPESDLLRPRTCSAPQIGGAVVFVWRLEESHKY